MSTRPGAWGVNENDKHAYAVFTVEIAGVVAPTDIGFSLEVSGSEGWLSLSSHHPYGFQAGDLRLAANVAFDKPEEAAVGGGMMGAAINVGEVYAHLARDLTKGSCTTPGFEHALHNARLIKAVARAAERGMRQRLGEPSSPQNIGSDQEVRQARPGS